MYEMLEAKGLPCPGWGETARQEGWSAGAGSNLPEEELWAGNWLPLLFLVHTEELLRGLKLLLNVFLPVY